MAFCTQTNLNLFTKSRRHHGALTERLCLEHKSKQIFQKSSFKVKPLDRQQTSVIQSNLLPSPSTLINKAVAIAAAAFVLSSVSINPALSIPEYEQAEKPRNHITPLNGSPEKWSRTQQQEGDSNSTLLHAHWDVHSMDSDTETLLVFSNESSQVIDVWWVDYCGKEVFYGTLNPGTTHVQPSFVSHPWVVRDHLSQNSVLVLVATPKPMMAVVRNL